MLQKDEAITRQERRKKCWSQPSREQRILKSSSWQHISVFICVQMKGHWQTLMVSSMKPACWPCGLIIFLETESLWSHFSDGLLHSMKYIKLLLELSASIDLCTVHRSTHGNKELFIVQEKNFLKNSSLLVEHVILSGFVWKGFSFDFSNPDWANRSF